MLRGSRYIRKILGSPIVVAWAAVVVSLMQLFFTVPLLSDFYMGAELYVSKMKWTLGGPSAGSFSLSNRGSGASNKIEVGLLLHPNGYVRLLPDVEHTLKCQEKAVFIKNCRLLVERVQPGESILVIVFRGTKASPEMEKALSDVTSMGMAVPRLEYVYSNEGVIKSSVTIENRNEVVGEVIR